MLNPKPHNASDGMHKWGRCTIVDVDEDAIGETATAGLVGLVDWTLAGVVVFESVVKVAVEGVGGEEVEEDEHEHDRRRHLIDVLRKRARDVAHVLNDGPKVWSSEEVGNVSARQSPPKPLLQKNSAASGLSGRAAEMLKSTPCNSCWLGKGCCWVGERGEDLKALELGARTDDVKDAEGEYEGFHVSEDGHHEEGDEVGCAPVAAEEVVERPPHLGQSCGGQNWSEHAEATPTGGGR